MSALPLLFTLITLAFSVTWDVTLVYNATDKTCSQNYIASGAAVSGSGGLCIPQTCVCAPNQCVTVQCGQATTPDPPANGANYAYYHSKNCQGDPTGGLEGFESGVCFACPDGSCNSQMATCDNGFRRRRYQTNDCSGDPDTDYTIPPGCSYDGPADVWLYTSCPKKCFHVDSIISYKGKNMKFQEFKESEECVIPHVFKADGIKIQTSCPGSGLRLTPEHLVMTEKGYKEAWTLKQGDNLYSSIHGEKAECKITSIELEKDQQYFGLNCYESHVLSDGIWVSTFGTQHFLPAAWMKYGGAILGIKQASAFGDSIATLLSSWALI